MVRLGSFRISCKSCFLIGPTRTLHRVELFLFSMRVRPLKSILRKSPPKLHHQRNVFYPFLSSPGLDQVSLYGSSVSGGTAPGFLFCSCPSFFFAGFFHSPTVIPTDPSPSAFPRRPGDGLFFFCFFLPVIRGRFKLDDRCASSFDFPSPPPLFLI